MREETILAGITKELRSLGETSSPGSQYFQLFQETLETATGCDSIDGLGGYIPGGANATTDKNIGSILLASAIMFAGAEIGDSIRTGLQDIASSLDDVSRPIDSLRPDDED